MSNRTPLVVGALAGVLGLTLMASLAPDTGPPVAPAQVPSVVSPPAPSGAVRPPEDPSLPTEELVHDADGPIPPPRTVEPLPPIDPDQVFTAELTGIASAAVLRRDRYQACWDQLVEGGGDPGYNGRLTVRITVSPDGDRGVPNTEVVNGPEDVGFQDCMSGVLGDAKFEAPPYDFTIMWPVPIRTE